MGKTLVTGGTGFLGSHLVRALAARGDEVRVLARPTSRLEPLSGIEFERASGDVLDAGSVRAAMEGVERVFHVAGITSMRPRDRERVFEINVTGTRHVLEEARRAGVQRVVHTSSVGGIGPAKRGGVADESQEFTGGRLGNTYVNSKHEAEQEAFRCAEQGLSVVCVNPTFVLGPDDPGGGGTSNALVRRFLLRRIPAYVEGALNIVDVRDVAAGHLLADERGKVGERYILGARNFTLDRLFADLSRISGVAPPRLRLPGSLTLAGVEVLTRVGLPVPTTPDEVRSGMEWWTYSSEKAERELGFRSRPHEETLEETVRWQMERLGNRVGQSQPMMVPLDLAGQALRLGGRVLGR
ncbi:MAG: SDR family oxidoreductase [Solirubrobacterales bacterium]